MIIVMCAVRDSAAGAFHRPFAVPTCAMAIRSFSDEVNRKGSDLNSHSDDFELFEIGSYDEFSGLLTPLPKPRSISRAKDVLAT